MQDNRESRRAMPPVAPHPHLSSYRTVDQRRTLIFGLIGSGLLLVVVVVAVLTQTILGGKTTSKQLTPTLTVSQELQKTLIKSGTLTWGADATLGVPFIYSDASKPLQVAGLDVDLMTALAQELQVQLAYTPVSWPQFPQALHTRRIDIYSGGIEAGTIPASDATFTDPYMLISDEIVVRMGDTRFTDITSLEGHPVGAIAGDRSAGVVQADTKIDGFIYTELPFEALAAGRLDAVVISSPLAHWYTAHDALHRFMILPSDFRPEPVALALPVGQSTTPLLSATISQALHHMVMDGALNHILQQWGLDNPLQACVANPQPPNDCP